MRSAMASAVAFTNKRTVSGPYLMMAFSMSAATKLRAFGLPSIP